MPINFHYALVISIHAPPRGATVMACRPSASCTFQFTPLREGRLVMHSVAPHVINFNSRPSARGDAFRQNTSCISYNFNSRPSARGDGENPEKRAVLYFNSRPSARGDSTVIIPSCTSDFNSRPSARGDDAGAEDAKNGCYFNSRPSARGDLRNTTRRPVRNYFNSRPSARGDGFRRSGIIACTPFQFTPLREGRQQKICNFCKSFVQPSQITAL